MGRLEGISTHGLMTASEIAVYLLEACGTLSDFDAYMFGSTLHGVGADIDILVVGTPGDGLSQLKEELRAAGHCLPLHLLFLQPSEAERTDFIRRENCVPLASLASRDMLDRPGCS